MDWIKFWRVCRTAVEITILAILLQASIAGAAPVEEWNRTFGEDRNDGALSVKQTSDGGYIVGGYKGYYSPLYRASDAWLIKLNSNGFQQWNRTFERMMYEDFVSSVQETSDGGYILTAYGVSANYFGTVYSGKVFKTDSNGIPEWNRTYSSIKLSSVQKTSDGGYIITGSRSNRNKWGLPEPRYALLARIDSTGHELWNRTFEYTYIGGYPKYFNSVDVTLDGGYIIAGSKEASYISDAWLVKTDSSGNELWNRTFDGKGFNDFANSVHTTPDGGYIIAGCTYSSYYNSYTEPTNDVWLIRTDPYGNKLWNRTFGGNNGDCANSLDVTPDGGYIIAGYTNMSGSRDAWLIRTDPNGNMLWNKTFGGTNMDEFSSVQQISNENYIAAGLINSSDAWLVKVKANEISKIDSCTTITSPGNYTLSRSIIDSTNPTCISITSSDVIFDGTGYTIDGVDAAKTYGVYVNNPITMLTNVTVKNLKVTDWYQGIVYEGAQNGAIESNNASSNGIGIFLWKSGNDNTLKGNTANSNSWSGIDLRDTGNNTLTGNAANSNQIGIYVLSSNNNLTDNIANSNTFIGIEVVQVSNNTLVGNTANNNIGDGFTITSSCNNISLISNTANNNTENGFVITGNCKNNTLTGNVADNNYLGFQIYSASDNVLNNNIANRNYYGIYLGSDLITSSRNNKLIGNNASNNYYGIYLHAYWYEYNYNMLSGNNVSKNNYGIYLYNSSSNIIYNNYFNNTNNARDNGYNTWNITKTPGKNIIGGPYLGGNYWSDYTGTDLNGDGLGDTQLGYNSSGNIINGGDYLPLLIDTIPPASIKNLKNISYSPNYINWTWIDPKDRDFTKVMVYINGVFKKNVSKGIRYYNATGLIPNTSYRISTHTVDISGNINRTWVSHTARTALDRIPPRSITNLKNKTYAQNYINWTWRDPIDADFSYVKIYIDGNFRANVAKGKKFYNATGFLPNTAHRISTRTVDTSGNMNLTWVNHTARTNRDYISPASITNLTNRTYARAYINWTWKDPSTYDFAKVMVYINGVFKTNITKGKQYYNATGLRNNTYYRISTHTVDTSGNINQTWRNHTAKTRSG